MEEIALAMDARFTTYVSAMDCEYTLCPGKKVNPCAFEHTEDILNADFSLFDICTDVHFDNVR